jgi:hypothetical protein
MSYFVVPLVLLGLQLVVGVAIIKWKHHILKAYRVWKEPSTPPLHLPTRADWEEAWKVHLTKCDKDMLERILNNKGE